ncbi:extracellular solute-binding protein [Halorubrum ezzemoulense]|jgi:iron(III) transport system substrate-binding protein|uniref:Extracellular solute-binding protein n=2 Tax=Halorubrum ezzemoulense TaxID=337243 RepID=A0A256K8Z2_HALEZ|nr:MULTISPECIES: extracellular solute-binding protein [Halorubrum]MDB2238471.1 extracellular solute-binding protein [Halorubrum ezzemoulense]MDB2242140.1 extracellular solute-binding protein [Halorubrum ezzemoulense]MDB2245923.1 extracellular solute-binding protein [Halorubrum ezzemoulense]MDB2249101.1 extracellular solute-binding protein [Halorubrum ezzemoulense]MDB2252710.1 extracellular solute-binding protein [Halorubrum ezzemoulense]
MTTHESDARDGRDVRRRKFLAAAGAVGVAGVAGCTGSDDQDGSDGGDGGPAIGQIGSGRAGRDAPGGTPMAEMPALEGELTVYSGRGEFLVGDLVGYIDDLYDDLDLTVRYNSSTDHVNAIINEGEGSPADVFYSVNAGSLGALADAGRTQALPDDVTGKVRGEFHTEQWVGTSGRARTVPYNTESVSEDGLPDDIMAYPDEFEGDLGWAPSYGSAQAFVTAMRLLEGEEATREWLEAMVERGAATYPDEFRACQEIADGEIDAAFTNHYYIQRVLDGNPEAPIATSFTQGDAGAVFNVAGAAVVDTASNADLAANFVRHLLSAEAQDYFARSTFEYPLIPEVEPIGDLPTIDELDVPDIDLSELSNLEPTIDLMRDAGVQI